MQTSFIKKMVTGLTLSAGFLLTLPSYADTTTPAAAPDYTSLLQTIANNTTNILADVNTLPNYIQTMLQNMLGLSASDNSQDTATMSPNFALTGKLIQTYSAQQTGYQPILNKTLINSNPLPLNANDLVYSTILNSPMVSPDPRAKGSTPPDSAFNYLTNTAGFNIPHATPVPTWRGTPAAIQSYTAYYNSVMAIESFNGYVLSKLYADAQNGNALSAAQMALAQQASSSTWLTDIASEEIGIVLRQLLMFQSQTYVLMTDLLQTQKQLLTAQAMTNTLLIHSNHQIESSMLANAQALPVTS